jgi:hypothetical protein
MNPVVAAALAVIKALAGNATVKRVIIDLLKDYAVKTTTKLDDAVVEIVADLWKVSPSEARAKFVG